MNEYYGHPKFYELTKQEMQLHSDKNRDYTLGGDPLGNFKRVSAVLKIWGHDISPELVALVYMLKQLDCAFWQLSQGYEGQVEGFDSRLEDVSIYAKLVRILKAERGENRQDIATMLPG